MEKQLDTMVVGPTSDNIKQIVKQNVNVALIPQPTKPLVAAIAAGGARKKRRNRSRKKSKKKGDGNFCQGNSEFIERPHLTLGFSKPIMPIH